MAAGQSANVKQVNWPPPTGRLAVRYGPGVVSVRAGRQTERAGGRTAVENCRPPAPRNWLLWNRVTVQSHFTAGRKHSDGKVVQRCSGLRSSEFRVYKIMTLLQTSGTDSQGNEYPRYRNIDIPKFHTHVDARIPSCTISHNTTRGSLSPSYSDTYVHIVRRPDSRPPVRASAVGVPRPSVVPLQRWRRAAARRVL